MDVAPPALPVHRESMAPSDMIQPHAPPADPMAAVLALLQEQKVAMGKQKAAMDEQKVAPERLEASQGHLEGEVKASQCTQGQLEASVAGRLDLLVGQWNDETEHGR